MSLASRLRARLARAAPPGLPSPAPSPAPRFVVRVVVIAFATVAGVLGAMSVVMVLETRAVVERGIAGDLAAAQRQLAGSQRDRQRDALLRASLISSSPTVKTVLELYQEQRAFGVDAIAHHELDALHVEIDRIAALLHSDGLAVVGLDGRVVVSAGPTAPGWPAGTSLLHIADVQEVDSDQVIYAGGAPYRATVAPIAAADGVRLAFLVDARRLDSRYAADLAGEARSEIAVLVDDRPIASTSAGPALATLAAHLRRRDLPVRSGAFEAGGERTPTCSSSASARPRSTRWRRSPRPVTAPPRRPCRGCSPSSRAAWSCACWPASRWPGASPRQSIACRATSMRWSNRRRRRRS